MHTAFFTDIWRVLFHLLLHYAKTLSLSFKNASKLIFLSMAFKHLVIVQLFVWRLTNCASDLHRCVTFCTLNMFVIIMLVIYKRSTLNFCLFSIIQAQISQWLTSSSTWRALRHCGSRWAMCATWWQRSCLSIQKASISFVFLKASDGFEFDTAIAPYYLLNITWILMYTKSCIYHTLLWHKFWYNSQVYESQHFMLAVNF